MISDRTPDVLSELRGMVESVDGEGVHLECVGDSGETLDVELHLRILIGTGIEEGDAVRMITEVVDGAILTRLEKINLPSLDEETRQRIWEEAKDIPEEF